MDQRRIGRYSIVRSLGSGAFSNVFLARMEGEGPFVRLVAMKRLHKEATRDPSVVRLLIREAEIGGLMHHDNVVATIDLLKVRDEYFLITEFVDGLDLGDVYFHVMDRGEVMGPALTAEVGHQICLGLDYIHRLCDHDGQPLRLVHRDLKPSNVLVHRSGRIKITDFGVASARAREQVTARDTIIGTPRYMSPEQAVAGKVSAGSDLYSLGVLLLQGLTSRRPIKLPYSRGTPVEELAPDPERLLQDLPENAAGFHPLLLALLQPHAEDRPASAEQVADELDELRSVYPLEDRVSTYVERWVQRIAEEQAEELEEGSLEELPSDRSGEFSILVRPPASGPGEGPREGTDRRQYSDSEEHPRWDGDPTDRDEARRGPPTVKDDTAPGDPTVRDDTPPFQPPTAEPDAAEEIPEPAEPRRKRRGALWIFALLPLLLLLLIAGFAAVVLWHVGGGRGGAGTVTEDPVLDPDGLASVGDGIQIEDVQEPAEVTPGPEVEAPTEAEPPTEVEPPPEVDLPHDLPDPPREDPPAEVRPDEPITAASQDADAAVEEPSDTSALNLTVAGHRRTLRNTTLSTGIDTGTTGCAVVVHWTVEGSGSWSSRTLSGDGPAYSWSLAVTAEHRPAILYYVEVSECGSAAHGSAGSPIRVVVR